MGVFATYQMEASHTGLVYTPTETNFQSVFNLYFRGGDEGSRWPGMARREYLERRVRGRSSALPDFAMFRQLNST